MKCTTMTGKVHFIRNSKVASLERTIISCIIKHHNYLYFAIFASAGLFDCRKRFSLYFRVWSPT